MAATQSFDYWVVDVFTDRVFGGNPLAVLPDARGLDGETMQRIAREFQLSETTFVLPADDAANDCRVRIFTPSEELPMAGHPTVGTAFVLAWGGRRPKSSLEPSHFVFEEGIGPVRVELDYSGELLRRAVMNQPEPSFGSVFEDRSALAQLLGLEVEQLAALPAQSVSCGVPFLMLPLRDRQALSQARVDAAAWSRQLSGFEARDLMCFCERAAGARVSARMFAPSLGIPEDPATGGAAGPLAAYLWKHGVVDREQSEAGYLVEQGVDMGRPSQIEVALRFDGDRVSSVRVGGGSVRVARGRIEVPS